ncbi:uncharacterized protein EURHEDRAFT_466103 [Aspergillus ruber CBS 135680]|uniref:Tr-type G domain-containing protein n=1 Tax=Aspergillus ruber (strain CBS 135680) TaxID=1388766 RepID=A0A017S3Y2_ASPRC|nr:uncharacterized protein EURHEDRAFT_466103 [Aspergillus ruber CBS 135680]EYE90900.1 hypothetical protein EURHEDRAFT_466103 [Aspergillus ruber CBS 135680]
MASIFTFDPDPPRVSSPWSISESSTPQSTLAGNRLAIRTCSSATLRSADHDSLSDYGISKLDPEPQEGPTEYKLHLLLRPRRLYTYMSTGHVVAGSYHSRASVSTSFPTTPSSYETAMKPQQTRSTHSRQERLQHLTTQLLWRLQQSSPFHSSTATNNLVLPLLPDMASQSDAPQRPARLLPGLEESQGALYEIGVADDGTFVGLTQDELEESLGNLQIMAGSLGCKMDVLRRVVVGECEWEGDSVESHIEGLWVAEALVSPDLDYYRAAPKEGDASGVEKKPVSEDDHSSTGQIRVSITGPSIAGKSSLLGTLTSSSLDNGRGKSRLSLLKHRHEISSGITSSVAQELIGYSGDSSDTVDVINYASGNVAAWDDIHAMSVGSRLAFVSDLPGSVRFSKSMLRGLISWAPHYVILCIPANCDDGTASGSDSKPAEQTTEIDLALSYLELCIKLEVPILIAITKMDLASRAGLRNTLAKVLSVLKLSGKKPAMLPVSGSADKVAGLQRIGTVEGGEVKKVIDAMAGDTLLTVPIALTSAVDGSGIEKLHAFLRYLPVPAKPSLRTIDLSKAQSQPPTGNVFDIDEIFAIPPSKVYSISSDQTSKQNQGVVLCGLVRYGAVSIGDTLVVGPLLANPHWQHVRVVSVRNLRLPVRKLTEDQVGTIGIEPISQSDEPPPHLSRIRKGTVLASLPDPVPLHTGFVATFSSSEFASAESPPLLLGGNAIVYIANIRTAVKVTCVELAENEVISTPPSPAEPEFFCFDGDPDRGQINGDSRERRNADIQKAIDSTDAAEDVHITFSFVTSLEWVEIGSRVLVMPGASTLASSAPLSGSGPGGLSGLEGFVGRVRVVI